MIYFLRSKETGLIKIGTTKDITTRERTMRHQIGDFIWLGVMDGSYKKERELLELFDVYHAHSREWFYAAPEVLEFIKDHTSRKIPVTSGVMRLKPVTQSVIKSMAATLPKGTPTPISRIDTALMEFFEQHYDDLPEPARAIVDEWRAKREGDGE